jgi:hypothetical protein
MEGALRELDLHFYSGSGGEHFIGPDAQTADGDVVYGAGMVAGDSAVTHL